MRIPLALFILDTFKQVLWQTVKIKMNCHIMQHFILVGTFYKDKKLIFMTRPLSAVVNVSDRRYVSDCRSRPGPIL